jgi:8-oxo-dGTP diphosphatase
MSQRDQMLDLPADGAQRQAVVALVWRDERVLFVRRSAAARSAVGYWTPVSGGIEPGETEPQALRREVREEVGLQVEARAKVACIPSRDGRYLLHFWTCDVLGGEAQPVSDEVADLRWLTLSELRTLSPVFFEDVEVVSAAWQGDDA